MARLAAAAAALMLAGLFALTVATESEVRAHFGTSAELPCRMDLRQCGPLHSVKWYKASSRLWLLNHEGKSKPEGNVADRMTMDYNNASDSGVLLKINDVQFEDEAIYKCEITYLEVKEQCEVIQIVKLKVLVAPKEVTMKTSDGETLANASVLGPKEEGDEVALICEATEGKPIPKVRWFNGTEEATKAEYRAIDADGDGVGTGTSVLRLRISRGDLNARFECRVESEALEQPIVSWITMEVHVGPTKMELSGVKNHVVQGTNVLLICDVFGARPPATVRWVNGSTPITNQSLVQTSPEDNPHLKTTVREEVRIQSSTIEDRDGTFTTKSQLVFQATHWENGQTIHCYAENNVTRNHNEQFHHLLVMDVRYPPVITVLDQYKNITINESTLAESRSQLLDCTYVANPQKLEDVMWSKDDRNLTLSDKNKYEGGDTTNLQLIIHNVTREDMGEYTCWLKNEVGTEHSEDSLYINVQYTPDVEIIMRPNTPLKAIDKRTVNLLCNVISGNPSTLSRVQWFLDGVILRELPECNYTSYDEEGNGIGDGGPLCGLDPSILSLQSVDKSFAGNYSCRGMNLAGWGPISETQELIIYYPPTPAIVKYYPSQVVKGGSVTLECAVEDPGIPNNITYIWMRGSHQMSETVSNFTISPVRLETRSNFTCIAQNEGGQSQPGTVFINVSAPPAFINKLPTYQGILYTAEHINLTCRVECSPLCAIVWKKNGITINTNNNYLYTVKTNTYPPDKSKNDFESIESTLIWNMTAWPGGKLDKTATNSSTYTCQSMSNSIGKGVDSTIEIAVDYPPEEVTVHPQIVDVVEGRVPPPVKCRGKGHPALTYQWRRAGAEDDAPAPSPAGSSGDELRLGAVRRADSGAYVCEASNKHGTEEAKVYVNVLYAPECTLKRTQKDGSAALLCTAEANPQEVTFTWKVREQNETFVETANVVQEGLDSYLILDSSVDTFRTYYCFANNTVAMSSPCEMDVQGNLPWYQRMDREKLIVIIASIVAIIICVIIICIVIIVLCRRKRTDAKSPNQFSTGDRMNNSAPVSGGAPMAGGPTRDTHPDDKGFYENLPFHGIQNPPNKPYRPEPCDLDYADADYRSVYTYGPINYKAASVYAAMKRNRQANNRMEEVEDKQDLL